MHKYQDLATGIHRQRLVVEGYPGFVISDEHIVDYLSKLSSVLKMKTLISPVTHRSEKFGWAGWIHWETSGAHFYAWEQPLLFFSVDIYTCKPFKADDAVAFTQDYFKTRKVAHKEF